MVKRGMLLVLAGLFLWGGAYGFYRHIQGSQPEAVAAMEAQEGLGFPFGVPGTELVVLAMTDYDGVYLEDGSVEEVTGITAVILENKGTKLLEQARVELRQGDERLSFRLEYLPAGEKILVLEENRKRYLAAPVTGADGHAVWTQDPIPGLVTVRKAREKILMITNPGPLPLNDLILYYKTYDYEQGMFLGGIAYQSTIHHLAPGKTWFAELGYYIPGQSRIITIKTSG